MLFDRRINTAGSLLVNAIYEDQKAMIVGSGIWFEALSLACYRLSNENYKPFVIDSNLLNSIEFLGGGWVQFVDFGSELETELSLVDSKFSFPDVIYLVEDVPGAHVSTWNNKMLPFLNGRNCRIVYLGEQHGKLEFD